MSKSYPYFKWYPADAETDDVYSGMTNAQVGMYHRLLNRAWLNNGIPSDPEEIRKILRMERREFARDWPIVAQKFRATSAENDTTSAEVGRLFNPRMEEERGKMLAKSLANQRIGNANAFKSRSENSRARVLRAYDCVSVSDSDSSLKGVQGETFKAPVSRMNGHGAEWSQRLYDRHPKKKDRTLVEHALFMVLESDPDPEATFREIDRVHALWCADFSWNEKNSRFAPKLADWLMDRGWTVEPHADKTELQRIMDGI